jgi:acyl-CoA thioester hydrolase
MAKAEILELLKTEIPNYKHKVNGRVKFAEVDLVGIVHNVQYFYMLEWARTEYLQNLGINLEPKTFTRELPLMVVHNELDYYDSLRFNDNYHILSRIASIGESSFIFSQLVLDNQNNIIAYGKSVFVYIDYKEKVSKPIPSILRQAIVNFENL